MQTEQRLLRPRQVAHAVGCSLDTVYRAITAGELEARRLGHRGSIRVERSAVERWLQPVTPNHGGEN